jgi:hypothetical protein
MPETFNPVTLQNNTGQPLNAAYFNRLEAGVESMDDRAANLELGINTVVPVSFSTSITLNATQGAMFQLEANEDFTLDGIIGGTNGQSIAFDVSALNAERIMSFTDDVDSIAIPAGTRWIGTFTYKDTDGDWLLRD